MPMSSTKRGFTLIELLVVIAIIGLLASIVFAGLGTARKNGRITASQGNLRNIFTGWIMCSDAGYYPLAPADETSNNGGGGNICSNTSGTTAKYPALPPGWAYCDALASTVQVCIATELSTVPASGSATTAMILKAKGDTTTITCTEDGCVKS
ncbi:MAG: type II secretion system protein [Candidatus Taylorbacteria bacterium]|nr:type II secretion system protein [Candidatus Taylorbacteria bacterium]